jgi:hypothetical protein
MRTAASSLLSHLRQLGRLPRSPRSKSTPKAAPHSAFADSQYPPSKSRPILPLPIPRGPLRIHLSCPPTSKRKLLTAKQTLHCGIVLVMTTLRGADGSCKVLTVVMEACRGQPRLQCGRVAAALLPQFSRFCTENNAIADVAHWPSHNPVAEASVGLHCTTVAEPDSISIHGFDDKHLQFPLFACRLAFVPINPYYRMVCACPRRLRLCKRLMLIDSETLLSPDTRRC